MACFLVPAAEAIVITVIKTAAKAKEPNHETEDTNAENNYVSAGYSLSQKLNWLTNLLWGGSALLAFEHLWHGEVVPWFPFLTAAANPSDTAEMLHEMSTVGVSMAILVTAVWVVMLIVSSNAQKKALQTKPSAN